MASRAAFRLEHIGGDADPTLDYPHHAAGGVWRNCHAPAPGQRILSQEPVWERPDVLSAMS
jgi:hypothetical protein